VRAALHVKNDAFAGMPPAALPADLGLLVESTDSVVQLSGQAEGAHVNSLVFSSQPTTGPAQHWVLSQRGPGESSHLADALVFAHTDDVSGSALERLTQKKNNHHPPSDRSAGGSSSPSSSSLSASRLSVGSGSSSEPTSPARLVLHR
jgi:hypothetical protein